MTLNYSEPGLIKVDMADYVKKVLNKMPREMDGTTTSPAGDYLFKIVEGIELLDEQFYGSLFCN